MAKKKPNFDFNSFVQDFNQSKPRESRKVNIEARFLIVCEGKKTEPNYFESFRNFNYNGNEIKLEYVFGKGGDNTLNLIQEAKTLKEKGNYHRVWLVFDKDDFPGDNFDNAIKSAKANGFFCAWSNESFELWFLLHFKDQTTFINREETIKKLKEFISNKKQSNLKRTSIKDIKSTEDMRIIIEKAGGDIEEAIKRAKKLSTQILEDDEAYAKYNPQTMVFKLVEELLGRSKELNKILTEEHDNPQ